MTIVFEDTFGETAFVAGGGADADGAVKWMRGILNEMEEGDLGALEGAIREVLAHPGTLGSAESRDLLLSLGGIAVSEIAPSREGE